MNKDTINNQGNNGGQGNTNTESNKGNGTNSAKELPQTGASASAYPLVGSLLVLLSGVVAFFRRKK
nr:LPXTG cell wall anchor domain-containing protein [Bacillus sp. UTDS19-33BHI26]